MVGEVVFNTSMTGYQEILTDPSYAGQLVTMTYPLIGNYGTNHEDVESAGPQVAGFVVREAARAPSSWRAGSTLEDYLLEHGVAGIQDVDTRALTRHIRSEGAMRGGIAASDTPPEQFLEQVLAHPAMEGLDLACGVSTNEQYVVPARGAGRVSCRRFRFRGESQFAPAAIGARLPRDGASRRGQHGRCAGARPGWTLSFKRAG